MEVERLKNKRYVNGHGLDAEAALLNERWPTLELKALRETELFVPRAFYLRTTPCTAKPAWHHAQVLVFACSDTDKLRVVDGMLSSHLEHRKQ